MCYSGSWCSPGVLLRAARFTTGCVRLVGQEPAPSKCVLMSTSRAVPWDMCGWVVTDEGDRWSVKLDVRYLGWRGRGIWILHSGVGRSLLLLGCGWSFPGWFSSLSFHLTSMAGFGLLDSSLRKLRAAFFHVVWSGRQPLASTGAVLSLLDGPQGCDLAFCVVWFRFRMLRRHTLHIGPRRFLGVYRLIDGASGLPWAWPCELVG